MSGPGREGEVERKPVVPRPVPPARGSGTPQPRPPSNTHSLLPSRSASVSRGGAPKMVFRPVRPPRRNVQVKEDPDGPSVGASMEASSSPVSTSPGPSRPPAPRPKKPFQRAPVEMTASGPFSMGSGAVRSRDAGKSRGAPSPGIGAGGPLSRLSLAGSGVKSESSTRSDYREPDKAGRMEREEYSDPEDDGVEIIDMEDVGTLDALAPTALPRMKGKDKKKKKESGGVEAARVKAEKPAVREEGMEVEDGDMEIETVEKDEPVKNADALDLSASEDEEVMDDLLDDFAGDDEVGGPENRLYLFQFPPLFPQFKPSKESGQPAAPTRKRSVAFADDTVGGGGAAGEEKVKAEVGADGRARNSASGASSSSARPEGQIGRLDVFRDGRVNFRFNDIVMEVTGGSQSSFLQQVMILDGDEKRATTLGELHRKFVVAPEIESMLNDVDDAYKTFDLGESDE